MYWVLACLFLLYSIYDTKNKIKRRPHLMPHLCVSLGWYALGPGCVVDEVRESPSLMESKPLFTFRIRHYSSTFVAGEDPLTMMKMMRMNVSSNNSSSCGSPSAARTVPPPQSPDSNILSNIEPNPIHLPLNDQTQHPLPSHHNHSIHASRGEDFEFDPKANIKKARRRNLAAAATAATAIVRSSIL